MDLLSRREHSYQDLLGKLLKRGCPEEVARSVLLALRDEGLLSDSRFAEALVRSRISKGYGPLRIRHDLQAMGVDEDLISQWLSMSEHEWVNRIQQVREKKFGAEAPGDYKERARQARFLQYRGFTTEQIHRALNLD